MGEVRLFAGAAFFDDDHELFEPSVERPSPLPFETAAFDVGLGLGYYFTSFFGVEAEFASMFPKVQNNTDNVVIFNPRAHLIFQIPNRFAPFVLVGGGFHALNSNIIGDSNILGNDVDGELHWGAGLKLFLTNNHILRVEGRQVITEAYVPQPSDDNDVALNYEVLGSFTLGIGGKPDLDKDEDGVLIPRDKCPNTKGITTDGCPDSDRDGISDRVDQCPNKAGTIDGCPDTDGDSIIDSLDKCPNEAGDMENGCLNPDKDGDGVMNESDKCPTAHGSVKTLGCPDTDNDSIADISDKCPAEQETVNGFEDNDGCPDVLPAAVKQFTGSIQGITFTTGSSIIRRSSYAKLNAAAVVLREYPELKIIIEGHTDSLGKKASNQKLSQARADAVKMYLTGKGVDESRLTSLGFGSERPIASNRSRAGRTQNRRIEFKLIE